MKSSAYLFFLLTILWISSACKGGENPIGNNPDPGAATPASSKVQFTAKIDGVDFAAAEVTAGQVHQSSAGNTIHQYTIKGESKDGVILQFTLQRFGNEAIGTGTYKLDQPNNHGASYVTLYQIAPGDSRTWDPTGYSGTITIDKITATETSGTFDLRLVQVTPSGPQNEVIVTNGIFKSNNYTEWNR